MRRASSWRCPEAGTVLSKSWSAGRELNPRILVLQTSALATSPPVLIVPPEAEPLMLLPRGVFNIILYKNENPTALG